MTERPQLFELIRDGERVAFVTEYVDGTTVTHWCVDGKPSSTVVWRSLEDAMEIHGHEGTTLELVLWP